jgi:hypothetical protein
MEVHAHTHTERKKWTHYLWEFLMLFLAVFCGFLAENQREHMIENQREKVYIQSLFEDLKKDTTNLQLSNRRRGMMCSNIDTLITLLQSKSAENVSRKIYYLTRQIPYFEGPQLTINSKTFEQLKSSGNLRLIRKVELLDKISDYYYNSSINSRALDMSFENRHDLFLIFHKLFDANSFQKMLDKNNPYVIHEPSTNPPLLTKDPEIINEICTRFHLIYSNQRVIISENERSRKMALLLIIALQKEYHLK